MRGATHVIRMRAGEVNKIVDAFETALLDKQIPIYQRGADLVHPIRLNEVKKRDGSPDTVKVEVDERGRQYVMGEGLVRRAPEALVLQSVTEDWLYGVADDVADWKAAKVRQGQGQWIYADPKPVYIRQMIARRPSAFPVLLGMSTTPILDASGRILQTPGYDRVSQVMLDFKDGDFLPIPEVPGLEEARAAYGVLMSPFREMPWANPGARSVAGSAMLTSLIRSSLRTAPMHVFDSPTAGTGKSKICDTVSVLATGCNAAAMSQGKSAEEDEKRLSVALHYGDPVVLIDNCDLPISGDFLCSCLTQETVQARILGLSERRITPVTCTFLASGNNVTTAGDMSRRVIISRIDAGCERPDERKFDFDPVQEARRDRAKMVIAGLVVLKAYHNAGRPRPANLKPLGSFEDWDAWIRGAIIWIGEPDPCDTREQVLEGDAMKNDLIEVMDLWERAFGDNGVMVSKVHSDPDAAALVQKLCEVTGSHDWNAKSVGWWLRRNKDRFVGGRCFRQLRTTSDGVTWKLHGATPRGRGTSERIPF